MRAAVYRRTGPAAEVLEMVQMTRPVPDAHEVLVQVRASGINPADVKRRAGWNGMAMAHEAVIPHCDGAGVIAAVGAEILPERVGERVWLWNAQGGYGTAGRSDGTAAEYIALPSDQAVTLPEELSFQEGACLGVPALTAWLAVAGDGPVAGKTVLVQGGAGAVGWACVQMSVGMGARVIATVGRRAAASVVAGAGDVVVFDRHGTDLVERVMAATDGRGVDRIVEVDLAANLDTDIACLAPHGVIASYSSSSDPNPVLPYYDLANLGATIRFLQGFRLPADQRRKAEDTINTLIREGQMRPRIGASYSLEDIASAHARVESGAPGQTVLSLSRSERTLR
ncbi:hypothetical protein ACMU_11725 [Actibacterium mucosum KCTC 23349]|uniref:Enoyl reductase (ER) domain-containing protein n=1 Tax=Actibacterium mucosum KCTC 23349 TaxID=1454373 RepID=A0A037ZGW0_9RHOB|nr:NADPH:quinone reductase [Actibacterium mucosum]KAJ55358.1 hypothetical protein ACMU_11725 [Actibacterium mucosum KCTC 23349]